jgi:hypothetical protein
MSATTFLGTGKVQGRYREGTGKVQGSYREGTGNMSATTFLGTGKVQGRYREGTGNMSATTFLVHSRASPNLRTLACPPPCAHSPNITPYLKGGSRIR